MNRTGMQTVVVTLALAVSAFAQNAALAPTARPQFFDSNGKPLAGGKLCTYQAGTTTPLTTYADSALTTPNANPIVLDVSGRATVGIYFSANTYKIVARAAGTDGTCSTGTVQWTQDNVADVGQLLRRDLADSTTGYGGALVAFKQAGAGAVVTDVQAEMAKTYRVSQFGTFAQAVAAATGHTLLIDSTITLPADTILPASVALRMDRAGLFKVATGSTLTIEGPLETGLFQIFSTEATDTGYGGAVVLSSVTELYPQWFGAQADGVTDDAAAIQAAVNTCPSRGCRIWFSPGTYLIGSSIVPKSNVAFVGPGFTMESSPTTPQAIIKGNGAFSLFSTSSATNSITWQGLALEGTADSGSRGIDLANPSHDPTIRDCFFDTFGDEAIRLLGGLSARLEHVFVQNAVLVRARADYIGAVDVSNTDARLDHVDATASVIDPGGSIPSGQIGDGYVASIVIRGANSHLTNSFGQISQVGIVVAANSRM
ncbi:MAG: glycoside hydrolase family 55 protein, partial [Acidobacteria bacterium]|nr:glycoside hydrolase family 55 protein [Acidobacteriota bacterium]